MIFIVYAESKKNTIGPAMGQADYSYYFVLQQFRPMLEMLGQVIEVKKVRPYVDLAYRIAKSAGQPCVFLSFTPPHKTDSDLACPTIPVFAWEYSTIPNEAWAGNEKNNWAAELEKYPLAITHSSQTCNAVKEAIGSHYPIFSIPAPLWDQYSSSYKEKALSYHSESVTIELNGWVLDSADYEGCQARRSSAATRQKVSLSGVVYTSVFNPNDGRKNWQDMLHAFCWAFKSTPDATLVFKLTHSDPVFCFEVVAAEVKKMMPFECRVVVIQGFLGDGEYEKLVQATHFATNSSYGEGQCLPLMEYMSSGKPTVAPDHSGMADYVNTKNSFVVGSSDDWTHWPHDLRVVLRTFRRQVSWESLHNGFLQSYDEAKHRPADYIRRAACAHEDLHHHCSREQACKQMEIVLAELGEQATPSSLIYKATIWPLYKLIFSALEKLVVWFEIIEYQGGRVIRFLKRKLSTLLG